MKLEDQVCSLELSKRLKELGVKQESLFYWTEIFVGDGNELQYVLLRGYHEPFRKISAFTLSELGEMFPWQGDGTFKSDFIYIESRKGFHNKYVSNYMDGQDPSKDHQLLFQSYADKEVDDRAKMLIYLIENKIIYLRNNNEYL